MHCKNAEPGYFYLQIDGSLKSLKNIIFIPIERGTMKIQLAKRTKLKTLSAQSYALIRQKNAVFWEVF